MSERGDIIDQANQLSEQLTSAYIAQARAINELPIIGKCHNCNEPLDALRFCDLDCRDDYEKRKKALNRLGRV